MAGRQLEKQTAKALVDLERWLARQPGWKSGELTGGRARSNRSPAILSESDCVLQFARFLNKQGVPWKDIHISVAPGQWLVEKSVAGPRPARIDLAVVDRDRLAKRKAPLRRSKQEDFLFDAIFEFTLAATRQTRALKHAIDKDTSRVRRYLDDLWTRRGYVVIVEESDHGWEQPSPAPVDALSVHYLKAY